MPSINPATEISSIDFESMIGGPLIAVVNAQAQAAMSTINFVKQVGFEPKGKDPTKLNESGVGKPIYVTFRYNRLVPGHESGGKVEPPKVEEVELSVPLLTMTPIPFIRVADTKIEFKAKIDAMERSQTDTSVKVDAELEAKAGWAFFSAHLKVNASYQRSTKEESEITRSYSMDVNVHAVQDEMPGGLERVLSILEASTEAVPVKKAAVALP
jgi:Protein of unknown function (DUF2589)